MTPPQGTGIGVGYNPPMVAGWSWFPDKKGMVNGIILTGFGAGGFIFNKIGASAVCTWARLPVDITRTQNLTMTLTPTLGTSIVNPDGLSTPFPPEVSAAFPTMLRKLAGMYAVMSIVGSLLIKRNDAIEAPAKGAAVPEATGIEFKDAIRSKKFFTLWLMILATAGPMLNMGNLYKKFAISSGSEAISSDVFQSTMGGIGAIFNGLGRLFWGAVVDVYGFEKP